MFSFRSNYFAVRDAAAFEAFCEQYELEEIASRDNPSLVGFLYQSEDQPDIWAGEGDIADENTASDFFHDLSSLLADNHVAVVLHVGNDHARFLLGTAWAINNKGQIHRVDLDDIYEGAAALGTETITRAEY